MVDFTFHTKDSAPEESKPLLEKAESGFGFVPNILAGMAEAPALLEGYMTLSGIFDKTSFTPAERQLILLTVSYENECHFCVAAHTGGAKRAEMDDKHIEALRNGQPLDDPKLEALRGFTKKVVTGRGWIEDSDVQKLLDAGYDKQNVLEVIVGVGLKTMSNYTNHIIGTPLNEQLEPLKWDKPKAA
ncbi:MAG: carboxymuconolactone decarboxylase family protein [Rhodovibrionaceae bacterium]|nr:carboxymuconolactone decarboxylase family protein [Rhodovibrionaceae bacterium]